MTEIKKKSIGVTFKIRKEAVGKVVSLCLLLVVATFIYNALKISKDSLVIPMIGAEIISTLKLWAILPVAVIVIIVYSKLANILSKETLFHVITGFFITFFLSFAFIIYPMHAELHPNLSSQIAEYPRLKWPLMMIANWTFSLFYIVAELGGNIILTILFWQTANSLNSVKEAKQYYGTFLFVGHIGHILSGVVVIAIIPKISEMLGQGMSSWTYDLKIMMTMISIAIFTFNMIHLWISRNISNSVKASKPKKKTEPMPISQSLKLIFSSKYIGLIALMIICYGISINIVEGVWKSQVRIQYPDSSSYNAFMGKFQMIAGSVNMVVALLAAVMIQRYSWIACAIITPIVLFCSGVSFFMLISMKGEFLHLMTSASLVYVAVIIGAGQNIFSKSVKYSLFDMTKEMAYIPLKEELKTKGKAAADLLGHKLGKSGGAFIQWSVLSLIPGSSLSNMASYFFIIFIIMMILWVWAVWSLNKEFLKMVKSENISQ